MEFLQKNWDWILLSIILLLPFIKPSWLQQEDKYWDASWRQWRPAKRLSFLQAFLNLAIMPLTIFLSLRGTVSLVIFLVMATDLIYRKQLSREAVILVSIGIIALYLEQLIEQGREFSFLGMFKWKGKDKSEEKQTN